MQRTIKFRGKPFEDVDFDEINVHISKDDFVYGNLIMDGKVAYIVNGIVEVTDEYIQLEQWIPVRPETIGQFTGLYDKNSKGIYEGDIVCDEDDLAYYKSISNKELLKACDNKHSNVIVVKYGLEEVDAFYGMAFNLWSFNNYDNGERLSREHIVISNIHDEVKK